MLLNVVKNHIKPLATEYQMRFTVEKINYHFFATQLMVKGIPVQVIQKLLGHSSSTTTVIYSKVVDSLTEEAVKKLIC